MLTAYHTHDLRLGMANGLYSRCTSMRIDTHWRMCEYSRKHICTLSASSHISCNCMAIPFWNTFNWFRFETPSKLLQEHFWDCKQLGSYCAEDPLQSNKSEATFKTCFRWNLSEESLFWTEITGNCFLDWRSRRKIGRWNKLVRIWNQLVIKTSLKKNLPGGETQPEDASDFLAATTHFQIFGERRNFCNCNVIVYSNEEKKLILVHSYAPSVRSSYTLKTCKADKENILHSQECYSKFGSNKERKKDCWQGF